MRAAAVVALLLHALPGAHGAANATFVRGDDRHVTYDEAVAFCTQIGATIASIHSAAENELARTACGGLVCWLGLVEYGGDAGTAAASQAWRWEQPAAGQTAIPAYTNWAAGEPDNSGGAGADVPAGADRRNAMMNNPLNTVGEWYDAVEDHNIPYPLCRVAGELNFTLDHAPQQCQVNTCIKGKTGNVPRKDRDPTCCGRGATTSNIKHRSCAPVRNQTYQLVQTDEACDVGEYAYAYKKYKCYPCKPGKTCDVGPGDEERCKWPGPGHGTFVGIFLVFLGPIICFICSVVAWIFAAQQNNKRPAARIQQQPVAIAQVRAIAPATSEEAPALPASVVSVVDAPAAGIAPNELGTVVSVKQPPANQR